MINVSEVKFSRTAILSVSISEEFLAELIETLSRDSEVSVSDDIEFRVPNKGAQIVHIFNGIHNGEIEFCERKEIAKAVNSSPASVSTILSDANKKGIDWAVSYLAKDAEQGELAAARRKVAELDALIAKHPELADFLKAKFAKEASESDAA